MGHWDQIGRDNAEERARRATLSRWRRLLAEHATAALIAAAWVTAIGIVLTALTS